APALRSTSSRSWRASRGSPRSSSRPRSPTPRRGRSGRRARRTSDDERTTTMTVADLMTFLRECPPRAELVVQTDDPLRGQYTTTGLRPDHVTLKAAPDWVPVVVVRVALSGER